jgi:hypothetical protein
MLLAVLTVCIDMYRHPPVAHEYHGAPATLLPVSVDCATITVCHLLALVAGVLHASSSGPLQCPSYLLPCDCTSHLVPAAGLHMSAPAG